MTPFEYYEEKCKSGLIVRDEQQSHALQTLQRIFDELWIEHEKRSTWTGLFRRPHLIKGLYLWGGVGIGKTFLMDCFFHSLSFTEKKRMHFHQFMQHIHQALTKHQGESDPLQVIAHELSKETMVLCFDEFYVSDI